MGVGYLISPTYAFLTKKAKSGFEHAALKMNCFRVWLERPCQSSEKMSLKRGIIHLRKCPFLCRNFQDDNAPKSLLLYDVTSMVEAFALSRRASVCQEIHSGQG